MTNPGSSATPVVTRLAPSPTGALHLGNARTFVLTWAHAMHLGGRVLLRIDDLDGPRVKPERAAEAVEDLRWLGLTWDDEPVLRQSERTTEYHAAIEQLQASGLVYACTCTRSEIEEAASAPHGPAGVAYPGTCRGRFRSRQEARATTGRTAALRFQVPPGPVSFEDQLHGACNFDPSVEGGDFPVLKRDGTASYQLATAVDDAASGVNLVIRGDDLLESTSRQILLQRALGLPTPAHLHLPLVVGQDGRRLAKRHGDTTLRHLRTLGWTREGLLGWIAASLGLAAPGCELSTDEFLARYAPDRHDTERVVVDTADWLCP